MDISLTVELVDEFRCVACLRCHRGNSSGYGVDYVSNVSKLSGVYLITIGIAMEREFVVGFIDMSCKVLKELVVRRETSIFVAEYVGR